MKCFVIMPFAKNFDDVYITIKTTVENNLCEKSFNCTRLDEKRSAGLIIPRLLQELNEADIFVADLTGNKPNVMWEVGYAMALNKPLLIVTQNLADLPFDLKDMQTLEYKRDHLRSSLGNPLKDALIDTISELKDKPTTDSSEISWQKIHTILNSMHRKIEQSYSPDVVVTMSGPGSFAACYCMSLNARDIPVVFATTFPKKSKNKKTHQYFQKGAEESNWKNIQTDKWSVFLPNVLKTYQEQTKILLFDDRIITGNTQKMAKTFLEGLGYEVRCAAMLADESNCDFLDYIGYIVDGNFYMPWGTKYGRT